MLVVEISIVSSTKCEVGIWALAPEGRHLCSMGQPQIPKPQRGGICRTAATKYREESLN